ncbi:MAG: LEA type 2 family protein [Polyangiaceae bacterium]
MRAIAFVGAMWLAACSRPVVPTVSAQSVVVTRVDANGIGLDVVLSANNSNSVDLKLAEVTSHLVFDKTNDVGTVSVPKAMVLPAGKTTEVDVQVAMPWKDVGTLAPLAALGHPVAYSVDGTASLGGVLDSVRVPFHAEGSIPVADIVRATVRALPALHF